MFSNKPVDSLDKSYLEELSLQAIFARYLSIDTPDVECGMHALHVQLITKILAEQLIKTTDKYQLSNKDIQAISIAASLHDIGKAYVSANIITNTEALTQEEYEVVKTHTLSGAAVLDYAVEIKDPLVLKYAKQICRQHHERQDGKGYPDKLMDEQIPIAAQIVAVADCYDALVSKRSYGNVYTHEQAVEMIQNGECGHLNPILLDCLKACGDEVDRVHQAATENVLSMDEILQELMKLNQNKIEM